MPARPPAQAKSSAALQLFHYQAYDAAGRRVSGQIEAGDAAAVEGQVRGLGLWLLQARPSARPREQSPRARRGVRAPRRELIAFFVEMTLLLRAGVTLPQALRRLADDLREQKLAPAVADLRDQVVRGTPLHEAMSSQPRLFPREVAALVQAGEAGGRLPEAFESLAAYYQWLEQLAGDVRQALIYPLMVMLATVLLVFGLFTLVVPRFVDLLNGLELHTPLITQVVMAVSGTLVRHWAWIIGGTAGLVAGLRLAARSAAGQRWLDRQVLRVPVFGPLIAMFALSRFAQNLGMLYRAGIPLLRGLEICEPLVGNAAIASALAGVRRGVSEGASLSQGLSRHAVFPPSLVTMIAAGETSGRLDFSLESIATYYNQTIPRRIKLLFSLFDPIVMLSLIGTVGLVALALVLPMLELWQAH